MTNTIDNFHNPEEDFQPPLSPAGRQRREQILQMAHGAARRAAFAGVSSPLHPSQYSLRLWPASSRASGNK